MDRLKWVREETFQELEVPLRMESFLMGELDRSGTNVELPVGPFADLYAYFVQYGGQILHRLNGKGELELFVCMDEEELAIFERTVQEGLMIERKERDRFEVHLLTWDHPDRPPFQTPFIFNLEDVRERYSAAVFAEQEKLPFFLLKREGERLIQVKCQALTWTDEMREGLRKELREAWLGITEEPAGLPGVRGEELKEKELVADGWAYQFDEHALASRYGSRENAMLHLKEKVLSLLPLLSNHRNSGIRKGSFLVWFSRRKGLYGATGPEQTGIVIFVTPFYWNRARGRKTDHDPLLDHFMKTEGWIRVESAIPIFECATPLFRYEEGTVQQVIPTREFLTKAAGLFDRMAGNFKLLYQQDIRRRNCYRNLLEMLEKE
jgi:hypothetical protein